MMFYLFLSLLNFVVFGYLATGPDNCILPSGQAADINLEAKADDRQLNLSSAPQKIKFDSQESLGVEITAQSAAVIDEASGVLLFKKTSRASWPLASIAKMMTALVWLESAANPESEFKKEVQILSQDKREGGIEYLIPGDKVKVGDLFYAALIGSDNTSAAALSRLASLDEGDFVSKMNQKAKALGLFNTFFTETTGLDPSSKSTAEEAGKLAAYAFKNKFLKQALTTEELIIKTDKGERKIKNTDELLVSFLNQSPFKVVAGKTGYLEESGYNLAVEIENKLQGAKIIIVVLGSSSIENRFKDAKGLAVWAFKNYKWQN